MGESPQWRVLFRVGAALVAEGALLVVLWLASSVLGSVDLSHLGAWVRRTSPTGALTALVRLFGMVAAVWLLASTLLYLGASLAGSDGLIRGTRWLTLPVVRRMVDAVTAASILASAMAAGNGSSSRPTLAAAVVQPLAPRHPGKAPQRPLPVPRRQVVSSLVSHRVVGRHLPHPGLLDHVLPAVTSMPAVPTPSDPFAGLAPGTKVVVVRPGDCLSVIAQEHLGDWRLDVEIHDLNAGRRQPDGRSLMDDHWIYPGWVLVMPADAVGTQVVPEPEARPIVVPVQPEQPPTTPAGVGHVENESPVPTVAPHMPVASPQPAIPDGDTPRSTPTQYPSTTTANGNGAFRHMKGDHVAARDRRPADLVGPTAGIMALAAAGLIWRLGKRRREQMHDRRTGERLRSNSPLVVAAETKARAIADTEAMRWVDAGLRLLGSQLAERRSSNSAGQIASESQCSSPEVRLPSVVLVRPGARGLEVMVAPASDDVPPHWTAIDEGAVWTLDPALELEDIERLGADRWSFLPALVTVGTTVDGAVLANLEHAGSLVVEGDPKRVRALMGQMLIELTSQPWTDEMLDGVDVIGNWDWNGLPGVEHHEDAVGLAEQLERVAEHSRTQLDEFDSAAARRAVDGECLPHVVFAFPGTEEAVSCRLAEAAQPDRSSVVIIAAGADSEARWRLSIDGDGQATLSGLAADRAFQLPLRVQAGPESIGLLGDALTVASEPEEPSPSVEDSAVGPSSPESPRLEEGVMGPGSDDVVNAGAVELRLLGTVRVVGAAGRVESARRDAPLAVLTYIATRDGPVNLQDLAAALWPPDSTKEHFGMPAPKTVNNIISRARTLVGRDNDGAHRLLLVAGGYVLSPSVTTDWSRFQALVRRARSGSALDRAGLLRQALELVEGTPLNGCLDSPFFEWASSEQLQHAIVAAVVDAAEDLARLCLDAGETETVLWAVELGVKMDPTREQLYQCWMHALGRSADVGEVTDVWRRLCTALQQHIDPGQCPSLDSQEVYRAYLRSADTTMKST